MRHRLGQSIRGPASLSEPLQEAHSHHGVFPLEESSGPSDGTIGTFLARFPTDRSGTGDGTFGPFMAPFAGLVGRGAMSPLSHDVPIVSVRMSVLVGFNRGAFGAFMAHSFPDRPMAHLARCWRVA